MEGLEMHSHSLASAWSFPVSWSEGRKRKTEIWILPGSPPRRKVSWPQGLPGAVRSRAGPGQDRGCLNPPLGAPHSRCPWNGPCPVFPFKRHLEQAYHCQDKTRYRIFVQWCPHEIFSFGGHCSDLTVLDGYVFLFCFVFSFPLNVEPIWSQCLLMCCWVVSSRGSKFAVSRARRFLFHQRSRFPSLRFP